MLEWFGGIAATVASFIYAGWALALAVAAVFLVYEGQCLANVGFRPTPEMTDQEKLESGQYTTVMDEYDLPRVVRVADAERVSADFAARKFARGRVSG
jgi:hypothetical protein